MRHLKYPKDKIENGNNQKKSKFRNQSGLSSKRKNQYFSFPRIKFIKFNCRFFVKIMRKMIVMRLFASWNKIEIVYQLKSVKVNKFKAKRKNKVLKNCFKVLKNPKYFFKKGEISRYTRPGSNTQSIFIKNGFF